MNVLTWAELDEAQRAEVLRRATATAGPEVAAGVADILRDVRARGDGAVRELTERLDGAAPTSLEVSAEDREAGIRSVDPAVRQAIREAAGRIRAFHEAGMQQGYAVETARGVVCRRVVRPVRRVGLYVPAGSAPLPSTALMLGIPAQLAGCPEVVLCTPPRADGTADPTVLAAADECGVHRVYVVGGAQAVAAMAYGTQSVPACDKIFGPGNAWVTEAKRQVSTAEGGPGIDLPAGPSELLVIADAGADPALVAADLLSQAEHGPDSQVMLLTDAGALAEAVAAEVEAQLADLPRADIARAALSCSRLVVVPDLTTAVQVSDDYAPEHLILMVRDPEALVERVQRAGSVFLGDHTPETLGDYCSGTNHVLPTAGAARFTGGVNVASFQIAMTVQRATPEGLRAVGPCAAVLAEAEQLHAHQRAITRRLARLEGAPA